MILYNLAEYLKTKFPAELFYTNERVKLALQDVVPDRNVLLMDSGGTEVYWFAWQTATVQVICRDVDVTKARALAETMFDDLTSRFGLILPAVTVDGVLYPDKQTGAILAIQTPSHIGNDTEGRIEYVFNLQIKYRRK